MFMGIALELLINKAIRFPMSIQIGFFRIKSRVFQLFLALTHQILKII